MIDVKVSIKNGDRLKSYNAWNKEMPIAVKGVGSIKDAFQLPPMVRVILPTDLEVQFKEESIKIYMDPKVSLKKALILSAGVQLVTEQGKVELYIQNTSDSLVTISDGEILAKALTND